jgi:hypothetical protein
MKELSPMKELSLMTQIKGQAYCRRCQQQPLDAEGGLEISRWREPPDS